MTAMSDAVWRAQSAKYTETRLSELWATRYDDDDDDAVDRLAEWEGAASWLQTMWAAGLAPLDRRVDAWVLPFNVEYTRRYIVAACRLGHEQPAATLLSDRYSAAWTALVLLEALQRNVLADRGADAQLVDERDKRRYEEMARPIAAACAFHRRAYESTQRVAAADLATDMSKHIDLGAPVSDAMGDMARRLDIGGGSGSGESLIDRLVQLVTRST